MTEHQRHWKYNLPKYDYPKPINERYNIVYINGRYRLKKKKEVES